MYLILQFFLIILWIKALSYFYFQEFVFTPSVLISPHKMIYIMTFFPDCTPLLCIHHYMHA